MKPCMEHTKYNKKCMACQLTNEKVQPQEIDIDKRKDN